MNPKDVAPENRLEALVLCEEENEKARRIILWCAQRMKPEDVVPLIGMVKGDIVIDASEEDREQLRRALRAVTKLTEVVQQGIDADENPAPQWWAKLDAHANVVRGLVQELEQDLPPTLHEVRNGLLK